MTLPSAFTPPKSVPDVVRRAQGGDGNAFEQLYREHSPRVYALCLRLCGGSSEEATELLQDAFIRAWRGLKNFRGESAFSSWLHRLTVNAMLERARSDKRRTARVLFMEQPGADLAIVGDQPDARMDLEQAIASLPEGARIEMAGRRSHNARQYPSPRALAVVRCAEHGRGPARCRSLRACRRHAIPAPSRD